MTMSLPDPDSLEDLSVGELRGLVAALIGEVSRLQAENQALRDEIAWLKGLPQRPPKTKPSGMEKTISASGSDKEKSRSKRRRGAKRLAVHPEAADSGGGELMLSIPAGARIYLALQPVDMRCYVGRMIMRS